MNIILFLATVLAVGLLAFWLMEKFARGWRTVVLNTIQGLPVLGGVIVELLEQYPVSETVPAKYMWAYLAGVIGLNIIFRLGTRTPVGRKRPSDPDWDIAR